MKFPTKLFALFAALTLSTGCISSSNDEHDRNTKAVGGLVIIGKIAKSLEAEEAPVEAQFAVSGAIEVERHGDIVSVPFVETVPFAKGEQNKTLTLDLCADGQATQVLVHIDRDTGRAEVEATRFGGSDCARTAPMQAAATTLQGDDSAALPLGGTFVDLTTQIRR